MSVSRVDIFPENVEVREAPVLERKHEETLPRQSGGPKVKSAWDMLS